MICLLIEAFLPPLIRDIQKDSFTKMKFLVCLLITLSVTSGALIPIKDRCRNVYCTMDLKICPDGTPAPVPVGECCPSLKACKTNLHCTTVFCTMDFKVCPDGTPAPIPVGECCPSLKACKTNLDCTTVFCTMDFKVCPDGTPAPVPVGECCPSYEACKTAAINGRISSTSANTNSPSSTAATITN